MKRKIVRSICVFSEHPSQSDIDKLYELENKLQTRGFTVQTKRLCTRSSEFGELQKVIADELVTLSVGTQYFQTLSENIDLFGKSRDFCNVDLAPVQITEEHVSFLFELITKYPKKSFDFAFTFNNHSSSPFMPSAQYSEDGFSIGFQFTDLSQECMSITEWLNQITTVAKEVDTLLSTDKGYLGIDTSIAPLFNGDSSLLSILKRTEGSLTDIVISDIFTKITSYIKEIPVKRVGLCGLMFPTLEDFELAEEYSKGNFPIERNLFLSLHSGLGIDTYPIGVDEDHSKVLGILKLVQALSNKYAKPLSVRFVSDGKSKIGDKTQFNNTYLIDTIIRTL